MRAPGVIDTETPESSSLLVRYIRKEPFFSAVQSGSLHQGGLLKLNRGPRLEAVSLRVAQGHRVPLKGSGSRVVPWLRHGSGMAQAWLRHGEAWLRHGSGMAQAWLRHGEAWLRDGSGMAQGWLRHGSSMAQAHHAAPLLSHAALHAGLACPSPHMPKSNPRNCFLGTIWTEQTVFYI